MKKLLTLKHWQLFGLMIGVPMIVQFIAFGSVIANNNLGKMVFFFPILMTLYMGLYFGWFYALGTNLHKKLPASAPMNLTKFKILLLIPVVYILLFSILIGGSFSIRTETLPIGRSPGPAVFALALMIPLHLFSMFCIIYCLYFNAKALKAVEWQRPVTFSDFAGEFFLLWFYPIGIWIIQPRVNQLFDTSIDNQETIDTI